MMTMTRKPKLSQHNGRSGVYQGSTTKEPLWRDLLAGLGFFVALLLVVAVVVFGGLLIFG